MTPRYTRMPTDYLPLGKEKVFVQASDHFTVKALGKTEEPLFKRQAQFEAELLQLARSLGTTRLPIFLQWPNVGRRRMDKSCVGHSVRVGFLTAPENCAEGYVSHVEINALRTA